MRKSQAKKWTLIVLVIFALVAVIGGTYSRYTSTGSGDATVTVAKWAVKINDADIVSTSTFPVTLHEVDNDNVKDGTIAPSSQLYADFVIDPDGSEVAIDYSFELSGIVSSTNDAEDVPADLTVSKVCLRNGTSDGTELTATDGKYTGTIELASQNAALTDEEAVTVRVYVTWTNTEANNVTHTAIGNTAPDLTMTITGTAKQHID